jgi:hypothetical protein
VIGAVQSKNRPVEPEPSRRFNLLFTVEGSGIQGRALYEPSGLNHLKNSALSLAYIFDGFAERGIRQHGISVYF